MFRKSLFLSLSLGLLAISVLMGCSGTTVLPSSAPPAPTTAAAASAPTSVPAGTTANLRLGRFTQSIADSFVTRYMIDHQLVEQAGKEMGMDLQVGPRPSLQTAALCYRRSWRTGSILVLQGLHLL